MLCTQLSVNFLFQQGDQGFEGLPGLPGMKGHAVSTQFYVTSDISLALYGDQFASNQIS